MRFFRKIIEIDEKLCDGCGQCIPKCTGGAIAIIDGKARLVRDSYCDGLGACTGCCPTGALKIIEREADGFDEAASLAYMAASGKSQPSSQNTQTRANKERAGYVGCPISTLMNIRQYDEVQAEAQPAEHQSARSAAQHSTANIPTDSGSMHWPLKMRIVPSDAPFLQGADILVSADCAAAASPALHNKYTPGKILLIGCPKFDNTDDYLPKLTEIFKKSKIKSCTVLRMEAPCCRGFSLAVDEAAKLSGGRVPTTHIVLSRAGEEIE